MIGRSIGGKGASQTRERLALPLSPFLPPSLSPVEVYRAASSRDWHIHTARTKGEKGTVCCSFESDEGYSTIKFKVRQEMVWGGAGWGFASCGASSSSQLLAEAEEIFLLVTAVLQKLQPSGASRTVISAGERQLE